jgi:hypothetical protein
MPSEEGVGLDEEALLTSRREHSAQPGEHGPVGPTKSGPRHLAPQDSKLVAQYNDLDGQVLLPPPQQPDQLEDTNESQVQEGERHALIFAPEEGSSKVQVSDPDGILGTHRFDQLMDKTIASALVDRLMHHAHLVVTDGESVRLADAMSGKGVVSFDS